MSFHREFGHLVRELRDERKMNLRQLSTKSRIALGYLSEVERGQKEPSGAIMESIANGLSVPLCNIVIEVGYRMAGWDSEELVENELAFVRV